MVQNVSFGLFILVHLLSVTGMPDSCEYEECPHQASMTVWWKDNEIRNYSPVYSMACCRMHRFKLEKADQLGFIRILKKVSN